MLDILLTFDSFKKSEAQAQDAEVSFMSGEPSSPSGLRFNGFTILFTDKYIFEHTIKVNGCTTRYKQIKAKIIEIR